MESHSSAWKVRAVTAKQLEDYLKSARTEAKSVDEKAVTHIPSVMVFVTDRAFVKTHKAYGIFVDETMAGYLITSGHTLDLLYISHAFRRRGLALKAIKELGLKEVVVNRDNDAAVKLYTAAGMEVMYDD